MLMRSFACDPSGWGELQNFTTCKVSKAPIFDEDFNLILKSRPKHNHFQIRYIQTIISINTKGTEIGDRLDRWCSDLLFVDAVWVFYTRALNLLWRLLNYRFTKARQLFRNKKYLIYNKLHVCFFKHFGRAWAAACIHFAHLFWCIYAVYVVLFLSFYEYSILIPYLRFYTG